MSDNPKVNRYLADAKMDHIDHALGRPAWPERETYRNSFAIDHDSDIARAFAASDHWEFVAKTAHLSFFRVTSEGRKALTAYLAAQPTPTRVYSVFFQGYVGLVPATSASKAKYSYFLEIGDSFDLTFGQFVRRAKAVPA